MVQPWTFKVKGSKHTAKTKNPPSPTAPSVLNSILSATTSLSPNPRPSKSEPQECLLDTNTKRKDKDITQCTLGGRIPQILVLQVTKALEWDCNC